MAIDLDAILANLPRSTADNPNYINEDLGTLPESNYSALINGQTNGYSALNANQPVMSNANTFTTRKVSPNQNSLFNQPIDYPTGTTTPTNSASYTPPNFKNNLLNYVVSPQGTGMAQGLLEASGYSTTPVSFGQALALGQKYATANQKAEYEKLLADRQYEIDKIKAQPEQFIQFEKDGVLYNQSLLTDKITKVGGSDTNINVNQGGIDALEEVSGKNIAEKNKEFSTSVTSLGKEGQSIQIMKSLVNQLDSSDFGDFSQLKLNFEKKLQALGFDVDVSNIANKEAFLQYAGKFVMGQIQNTKGAVSEREMDYFALISPTLSNTKEGLTVMLDIMDTLNTHQLDIYNELNTFRTKYLKDNPNAKASELESALLAKETELLSNKTTIANKLENIFTKQQVKSYEDSGKIIKHHPLNDKEAIEAELKANGITDYKFAGFDEEGVPKYYGNVNGNYKTIGVELN